MTLLLLACWICIIICFMFELKADFALKTCAFIVFSSCCFSSAKDKVRNFEQTTDNPHSVVLTWDPPKLAGVELYMVNCPLRCCLTDIYPVARYNTNV